MFVRGMSTNLGTLGFHLDGKVCRVGCDYCYLGARAPLSGPVIVCYDRSDASIEAVAFAAALLAGARALVVSVWRPVAEEGLSPAAKPPGGSRVPPAARRRAAAG